jgi:hypothetical protein
MTCIRSRLRLQRPQAPGCHGRPKLAARSLRRPGWPSGRRACACVAISPLGKMAARSIH